MLQGLRISIFPIQYRMLVILYPNFQKKKRILLAFSNLNFRNWKIWWNIPIFWVSSLVLIWAPNLYFFWADIPKPTCKNQDVNCGFGFAHMDVNTECVDCLDNGDECCVPRTCGNPTGITVLPTNSSEGEQMHVVMCDAEGLKPKAGSTKCTLCMDNHDECCTKQETCWTSKTVCPQKNITSIQILFVETTAAKKHAVLVRFYFRTFRLGNN